MPSPVTVSALPATLSVDVAPSITAIATAINGLIALGTKVWDATPPAMQQQSAADWAKFTHNLAEPLLSAMADLSALFKPPSAPTT